MLELKNKSINLYGICTKLEFWMLSHMKNIFRLYFKICLIIKFPKIDI